MITGIGGVFIESKDPEKLIAWYKDYLGIPINGEGQTVIPWNIDPQTKDASTTFHVYSESDKYFKPSSASFMINFRVQNLEESLRVLKEKGVKVYSHTEEETYGKFGWIEDIDGNKVELWEPSKGN